MLYIQNQKDGFTSLGAELHGQRYDLGLFTPKEAERAVDTINRLKTERPATIPTRIDILFRKNRERV